MDNFRGPYRQQHPDHLNIPAKANRILNIILVGILLIVIRIWHLTVIQYDEKLEESRKPQRRTILEPAKRATIRDRFNIPLAANKIQYNLAILYSHIKQIPPIAWDVDDQGKRFKRFRRKEYIAALSNLIAQELDLDSARVEDLIHAKASLYNQIPFVIKEDLSEQQYYKFKMLEKDWVGINVQRVPKRYYPLGKVGGDIIGYMGAINRREYDAIIEEIKTLENLIDAVDEGETITFPFGLSSVDQIFRRLKDLHEQAYSMNDSIGKGGIEGRFEHVLRGFRGKKSYYSDAKGNFLAELPGSREPLSGKRLLLTISSELQEFAESLLIQNEKIRQTRLSRLTEVKRTIMAEKHPWIKGGAIVAMDPNTGEILAMASHPRFDPNDFISSGDSEKAKIKRRNIHKWLENEAYIGEIWDQKYPLEREFFNTHSQSVEMEELNLNWFAYLDLVLSLDSPLKQSALKSGSIKDAITVQKAVDSLLELFPKKDISYLFATLYPREEDKGESKRISMQEREEIERFMVKPPEEFQESRRSLETYLSSFVNRYEQILFVDLMRLVVVADRFSDELIPLIDKQTLYEYREASASMVKMYEVTKKMAKELFHEIDFRDWRKENEKTFLKRKREEEKTFQRYAKPYIEYLDEIESEMFQNFWDLEGWNFLAAFLIDADPKNLPTPIDETLLPYFNYFHAWYQEIDQGAHQKIEWAKDYARLKQIILEFPPLYAIEYLKTMRGFNELNRPLFGDYRYLRKNVDRSQVEKHLAMAFYPRFGYGYGRSQAYRQAATQGSIFKLVTAYEALIQQYQKLTEEGGDLNVLNPLEIVDVVYHKGKDLYVGYDSDGKSLPRFYKGGRLPRSLIPKIGKIDIIRALEMSSNPYFSLIAGDVLNSPNDLARAARLFSFGDRTGIELPGEISGSVPTDLENNRTGLYSFAIGQHTLVVTPLQTTVMLSALANGGKVLKPKIIHVMVGKEPKRGKGLIPSHHYFPYQEGLSLIGIDYPLFVAADAEQQLSLINKIPMEIKREIFLPDKVRRILLDGMCRVVSRSHSESLPSLSRLYHSYPKAIDDYVEFKHRLLGKTSTSESIENIDLDPMKGTNIYTHVWFGGITYEEDSVDLQDHHFLFRDSFGKPELVVVVYLRYGGYGKEAAPLAAQVAKKWKEIQIRYESSP